MEARLAPTSELAIEHVEGSLPAEFKLTRIRDGKSLAAKEIPSPYGAAVAGHPGSLMEQLRWYLEHFPEYPFPPETGHAEHVLAALKTWGTEAFNALFDRRDAGDWLNASKILQIRSDDANVLSWPWEALFDPQAGSYVAHQRQIERRLNQLPDPAAVGDLPKDEVRILLVVARPYQNDVAYRSIARPLVELIGEQNLPAQVTVLRPPAFDNLREHLRQFPNRYHVLHFDGHGAFGAAGGSYSPDKFGAKEGCLVFEDEKGGADAKTAGDLSALLKEYALPAVVLNACQSAALDETAGSPFSSVATALLQSGMRSVVAMSYSLYVSGAKVFLPAFYKRLFEKGDLAEGVRAGRQQMLAKRNRGGYEFEDWLLPVLYQQAPIELAFGTAAAGERENRKSRLPEEVRRVREEYGFIGRDRAILDMERALHRQAPCILIQGLGGVGKTTLARGFLRWLDETDGLDAALWFDFRDIRTAEFVINQMGQVFYGENFGVAKDKLDRLAKKFGQVRIVVVWDNFESAAVNLPAEDKAELGRFLTAVRGKKGKVIVTSRAKEEWLSPPLRYAVSLRGLEGEERWEFCDVILRELGIATRVEREGAELAGLMDQLGGHPLAMRVVLPKLEEMRPAGIAEALRTNIAALGLDPNEEQGRLFGTLRFVEQGLPDELQGLMPLIGLHEGFVSANLMESMGKRTDPPWERAQIDQLMFALASAGLLKDLGQAVFEMHPLLTSYLRALRATSPMMERAFASVMAEFANGLTPRELHEQRGPFHLHGANFRAALETADRLSMVVEGRLLVKALGSYAQNARSFLEAARMYGSWAKRAVASGNFEQQAAAYHQLGRVAEEQRDFATAHDWYLKSLAVFERQGDEHGAASAYHQLGMIAEGQRDFATARDWYLKSLLIKEKQGNGRGAAMTYHQLGTVALKQGDFATASECYLKSLAIDEGQRDEHGAAQTYHQLGTVALQQRDFATAHEWYLKKALPIHEKQGNEHGAAQAYHQLGRIAQEERDFAAARDWYLRSLVISEKQGSDYLAAGTYGQLGSVAGTQGDLELCAEWLIKAIRAFVRSSDQHSVQMGVDNFVFFYRAASPDDQAKMKTIWEKAGLGDLPSIEW